MPESSQPNRYSSGVSDSSMSAPGVTGVAGPKFDQIATNEGAQTYALGIATVMQVDHAKHEVTLRVENGETFSMSPISMTYPGAGARHFLGAMPMPGDVALVGWGAQESGRSKQPYVLTWFPGGVMAGHDWWPMQPFGKDEFDLTPKERTRFEGIANRTRYKLRHMLPGNVMATSAQGSDFVLDEGVLLTSRRGSELRLRDEDGSMVFRSLQQFHAGSGFRAYSGMVQRDALLLPTSMFSDGTYWDAPRQVDEEGRVLRDDQLELNPVPAGRLTPNPVFQRDSNGTRTARFPTSSAPFSPDLDPYIFLQRGLIVDPSGNKLTPDGDAVSGGKAIYRVSTDGTSNAASNPEADALVEYRIEVSHTSDGHLPVTEQTDGFDADRLPDSPPQLPGALNGSKSAPFVELVLGSVVGNDPYSLMGRSQYGIPLRTQASPSPGIYPATGHPIGDHAAVLLRVSPALDPGGIPTFWSVTKDGRVVASVVGPEGSMSADVALSRGLSLSTGREGMSLSSTGSVSLTSGADSQGNGLSVVSGGTLYLRGGGQSGLPNPDGSAGEPGISLVSDSGMLVTSPTDVTISAASLTVKDAATVTTTASSSIRTSSGGSTSTTTKTRDLTVLGKSVETYSGPKDGLASFGPAREVTVAATPATGFPGGVADQYTLVYGDREERLLSGGLRTTALLGDVDVEATVGTWTARAAGSTVRIGPGGAEVEAVVGPLTLSAKAGSATLSGSTSVEVSSLGSVSIKGSVITLTAPGLKTGGIVSGSDLDPLSGLPLGTLGLGSPTHLLSAT